ncbi:hypothetical protein OG21DRAFT_1094707 [Imleria badia]|nr:hypothetical protein OG21DRAFT_1094707 [Imleria badia]
MILRVWAMYTRSRLILGVLLILFSVEISSTIVAVAFYSDSRNVSAVTIQILDVSFCALQPASFAWPKVAFILQITHGGAMCILAVVQFMKQSLETYRVTKQWQLNRYMNLLVRQGILYFFA